jgi:hypothetical protein
MNDDNEEDEDIEEDIEVCLLCNAPGDAGTDGTFYGGAGMAVFVHARCLSEWRQRVLTNLTTNTMNQPQQPQQRLQSRGRMRAHRGEDYAPALDQAAGAAARRIIKESSVDDTTEHWRAIKKAYLAGYADAQR